ncbi:MAG: DUF3365 domain-containing protein [Bacteroidales bacterium]|nr:DUF3365 domain-containing protein [Bacteroidales bacterium]
MYLSKRKLSKYKTSTILLTLSIAIIVLGNIGFVLVSGYMFRSDAIQEAKEKATLILDKNLSVHDYFTNDLKPKLFDLLIDTINDGSYFEPGWMSSSYAIMHLDNYFQQRNDFGYYYKDATLNARNLRNEADSIELNFLNETIGNREIAVKEGIIELDGSQYYFLLKKGEVMVPACLRCHGMPEKAPKELVEIYGNTRSFNRKVGDVISVVSIRIPIDQAYVRANRNILILSFIISIIAAISILTYVFIQKRLIINPLEALRDQAISISNDNSLLGKPIQIDATKDITDLISSFNLMSVKLYDYHTSLEEKVKEKTIDLEQTIAQVRQLNITKDKFFSIIAHDLKSPLSSIVGFSEILMEQLEANDLEGIDKYANIILKSSNRAMDLLMNLMEWSLSQTGRITFNPENFNMNELIREIVSLFENTALQKSVIITTSITSQVPVLADRSMVSSIVRNLVSNAIKFSHPGGEILIKILESKGEVRISVSDNGIGIPKSGIEKLFRIDENFSNPGTQNEKGTGLGLILCKEFVNKHGGKIWVQSEVGKGSTFYFTLSGSG